MSDISRAYIRLAHQIEQHQPGYIDSYYGPKSWIQGIKKRSLSDLKREADQLASEVQKMKEEARRLFLAAQVRAMQTSIALLQGEKISYIDEVYLLYDVKPQPISESQFDDAIAKLDELLPGKGDIATREQAFRQSFEVPAERLPMVLNAIVSALAYRTRRLFRLPSHESFDVQYVKNQPWSAYNWYLGRYRSRIDINTDLPSHLNTLPDLVAHEAYPGHHTEHVIKEQRLWQAKQRGEHSILLINAPECVVSEGIATHARRIVINDVEVRNWMVYDLVARTQLKGVNVEAMLALRRAKQALGAVSSNAALLYHQDGASKKEVLAYIQRYGLRSAKEADKSFDFLTHPNFRSYLFTYRVGSQLLEQLFQKGDSIQWFTRLLTEPITPSIIRGWIASE